MTRLLDFLLHLKTVWMWKKMPEKREGVVIYCSSKAINKHRHLPSYSKCILSNNI